MSALMKDFPTHAYPLRARAYIALSDDHDQRHQIVRVMYSTIPGVNLREQNVRVHTRIFGPDEACICSYAVARLFPQHLEFSYFIERDISQLNARHLQSHIHKENGKIWREAMHPGIIIEESGEWVECNQQEFTTRLYRAVSPPMVRDIEDTFRRHPAWVSF